MLHHQPSAGDEPKIYQSVNPNTSVFLVDSVARDIQADPLPTDFNVQLSSSASGVRRLVHRNLQWTQPIWTHTLSDWDLVVSFSSDNYVQKYVTFMFPFVTFHTFAGDVKDGQEYQTPDDNSYCAMLQQALIDGLRPVGGPVDTIDVPTPPPEAANFRVYYSRYRGLLISLGQTPQGVNPPPYYFRIEPCGWLSRGHHVHGFGVRREPSIPFSIRTKFTIDDLDYSYVMEPNLYQTGVNMYFSSGTPIGIYTRFVIVTSREATRNRKITSFSNLRRSASLNANELTVQPTVFSNLSKLKNYVTSDDPTVINLRPGDNLQSIRISMRDEHGELVESGLISGCPLELYPAWLASRGIVPGPLDTYDLSATIFNPISPPGVIYDNAVITAVLRDTYSFFRLNKYGNARIDSGTPIIHFFEMIMF